MAKKSESNERTQFCYNCFHLRKDHEDKPCSTCFGVRMEKRFCYKNWKKTRR